MSEYLESNEMCFSPCLGIFKAIAIEYFQGACDHFLVADSTGVPGTVRPIFGMELITPVWSWDLTQSFVWGSLKTLDIYDFVEWVILKYDHRSKFSSKMFLI